MIVASEAVADFARTYFAGLWITAAVVVIMGLVARRPSAGVVTAGAGLVLGHAFSVVIVYAGRDAVTTALLALLGSGVVVVLLPPALRRPDAPEDPPRAGSGPVDRFLAGSRPREPTSGDGPPG